MKNARLSLPVLLLIVSGTLTLSWEAGAQACKSEAVKLTVNQYGLWLKPDGARCLFVSGLPDVDQELVIRLKTPGPYQLRDGQVTVREAATKVVNGVEIDCGENLDFEAGEYTNVGENDIVTTIVGSGVSDGEYFCYDIIVEDIGMLDPRAQVEENLSLRADEVLAIIQAYNLLIGSGVGDALTTISIEDFVDQNYDLTAEEQRLVQQAFQQQE